MMYKSNVTVCSEIRTKHSMQSEHRVEFLNVKPGGRLKKPLGFKWLMQLLFSSDALPFPDRLLIEYPHRCLRVVTRVTVR
jgi:hypothetical protein